MSNANSTSQSTTRRRRKDMRPLAAVGMLLLVLLIGAGVRMLPDSSAPPTSLKETTDHPNFRPMLKRQEARDEQVLTAPKPAIDPNEDPSGHARQAKHQEAELRFQQALVMLNAQRFDDALVALDRVLNLRPDNVDALTNKGFALLALEAYQDAFAAFDKATDLKPTQANAYYGAAIALEHLGNLEGALSGMRSFLHLTDMGPEKLYVARARSAIWEWESQLGRGPWGPTKGIPPGFSEEEVRRDGRGVGIKMPLPETKNENGLMKYEIKTADKIEIFER